MKASSLQPGDCIYCNEKTYRIKSIEPVSKRIVMQCMDVESGYGALLYFPENEEIEKVDLLIEHEKITDTTDACIILESGESVQPINKVFLADVKSILLQPAKFLCKITSYKSKGKQAKIANGIKYI